MKKLSREELKKLNGGKLPNEGGGFNCADSCSPSNDVCGQYGLTCGMWAQTNSQGDVLYACLKCV